MKLFSFRNFRILIALIALAGAAIYTKQQRLNTQGWYEPLVISLIPINADKTDSTQNYINKLEVNDFNLIESFLRK